VSHSKSGALKFSLEIIETFLEGDVNGYIDRCADTLYTLEGEGPFTLEEWEPDLREEEPFPFGEDYSEYSMDDFEDAYDIKVYDHDEYMAEFEFMADLDYPDWSPDEDDYLFWAQEKEEDEGFIWDDLLAFMVTVQDGDWVMIALSG